MDYIVTPLGGEKGLLKYLSLNDTRFFFFFFNADSFGNESFNHSFIYYM